MSISVLTIVKNRAAHLAQLIEGLRRSVVMPDELIIVDMNSDLPVVAPEPPFATRVIRLDGVNLPLAAARNAAAHAARGNYLLFLDVDCIPMQGLVGAMQEQLRTQDAIICAEAFYLGPDDARENWTEAGLRRVATSHPARPFPVNGTRDEKNPGLFWSLIFGIRRTRFEKMAGFDEAYTGYGAEDTDFGFRARRADVPLKFMGSTGAFHQHHAVYDPPLQHIEDIVRNAQLFHERWLFWPMEGWLRAFADAGLIEWSGGQVTLLRPPSAVELAKARSKSAI